MVPLAITKKKEILKKKIFLHEDQVVQLTNGNFHSAWPPTRRTFRSCYVAKKKAVSQENLQPGCKLTDNSSGAYSYEDVIT